MSHGYEIYAVTRLINRYDYDGACEILDLLEWHENPIYLLIQSCQHSLNFNFKRAQELTDSINKEIFTPFPRIIRHIDELPNLIEGKPHHIFNELLDNLMIQLEREAYTDFLGRIFQVRELLYKNAVIQFKERKEYSIRDPIYQKKLFERRFKLNQALLNGMKDILRNGGGRWKSIVNILSGKPMSDLMDLRHRTIVAHGIETVSLSDINRIYGSTEQVFNDLFQVFKFLNIPIRPHKYKDLNKEIVQILLNN